MTKLFIGSLPYNTTSQELQSLFETYGQVLSASVITDKFTGQSRGFGFVEMANDDEAQKAIEALNGSDLNGRNLAVSVARPREERPERGNFQRGDNQNRGFERRDRR